jgi:hypothetical protein
MPRIKDIPGPYHIYFVSFDCSEPSHVHVARERMEAKFWLEPIELAYNYGFGSRELNKIRRLIAEHHNHLLETWDEHCNSN